MSKTYRRNYIDDGEEWVGTFCEETGDELKRTNAKNLKKKPKNQYKPKEFLLMHERIMNMLEKKEKYNNLTFRLLFNLLKKIEFNNRISSFSQDELAQELNTHQQRISMALKTLRDDGIIVKQKRDYYFAPKFIKYANDGNFAHLGYLEGTDAEVAE
jgi:DNA-binding MarR family transcriptional regulator